MARFTLPFAPVRMVSVAALLVLTACSSTTPSAVPSTPEPTPVSLAGTAWTLETLGGQAAVDDTTVTARFGDDGTVSGSGGCNRYSGKFTTSGDTITVEDSIASTMMACDEAIMTQETAFFTALKSAKRYAVDGDKLTLSDDAGAALAVLAVQSQELAGSTWTLTGYNNAKGAVTSLIIDTSANITFSEDGKVSGTSGCNRFMGTFTLESGVLKVGPLAGTRMMCVKPEGVMEQEAAVLAALQSAVKYTIDGDKLRLINTGGETAASLNRG